MRYVAQQFRDDRERDRKRLVEHDALPRPSRALEPAGFGCDYVGQVPAAKGYGTMRMYHLHAPPEER